jgi:hypothetical protein
VTFIINCLGERLWRIRLAQHIARTGGIKILIAQPEGNRLLGIQMRRWKNDIERFINIVYGLRIRFFGSKY